LPLDRDLARQTRFQDRIADTYVMEPLVKIVTDGHRPENERDPSGVAKARATLDRTYALLDKHFASKTWAIGDAFTMADCAYGPPLAALRAYHPFSAHASLVAYFERLVKRPAFARVLKEAEPYFAKLPNRR
jgi:glutathione S-transferase